MTNLCPLCQGGAVVFHKNTRQYLKCSSCHAVFMDKQHHLNVNEEKLRYLDHENDVTDPGYQDFVSPITSAVLRFQATQHKGLDFGAGTGPVITKVLSDNGYKLKLYDPFFHNNQKYLTQQYDFIVCCEVMEHFYHPNKEFELLKRLLKPGGRLYCMTELYYDDIDFQNWYYQKDNTHVFFYHNNSLDYIKQHYQFSDLTLDGRLITFTR